MRAALDNRFLRFLVTGGVNTLFGYAVYYTLLRVTGDAQVALALGTVIGVAFNFFSTGRVVFASSDPRLIGRFVGVYVVVYLYNAAGLAILGRAGVDPALGALLLLPGAVTISWLLNSRWVFVAARRPRSA